LKNFFDFSFGNIASEKGCADIVKLLLENGANFNLIDLVGQSALDLGKFIK
jgi:ankyrin repeat protein